MATIRDEMGHIDDRQLKEHGSDQKRIGTCILLRFNLPLLLNRTNLALDPVKNTHEKQFARG